MCKVTMLCVLSAGPARKSTTGLKSQQVCNHTLPCITIPVLHPVAFA